MFEIRIVQYFNRIGSRKFDDFLALINSIRFLAFFWFAIVIIAIVKHPEIINYFLAAVAIVAILHFGITEGIIKHLLLYFIPKRKRPYVAYPDLIKSIGKKFSDSSFPSSHMASTVAMLFVIVSFYPSLFFLSVTFVLIMAFSRLHSGMHYPSDILAGIVLGLLYGWIAMEILKSVS
ncbi:MAG: Phosphoesterase PA-phosphatase related protein [Parcubacteria group bacterium GW2011_GWD2_38_11]|nr:MAG: Phosphoesterase PA-phosphatase related protein [Parcubacteria group bacterium GW2011_GWD2_38_11]